MSCNMCRACESNPLKWGDNAIDCFDSIKHNRLNTNQNAAEYSQIWWENKGY